MLRIQLSLKKQELKRDSCGDFGRMSSCMEEFWMMDHLGVERKKGVIEFLNLFVCMELRFKLYAQREVGGSSSALILSGSWRNNRTNCFQRGRMLSHTLCLARAVRIFLNVKLVSLVICLLIVFGWRWMFCPGIPAPGVPVLPS